MGRKSRENKPKGSDRVDTNRPSLISLNMKPPDLQHASPQGRDRCKEYDCEIHKLVSLVADIATGIWRTRSKLSAVDIDSLPAEVIKAHRHIGFMWDALSSAKIEVQDHTNEKYVAGLALKVIAFQPSPSVHVEIITETIKPSIFYNDRLIQMGEVIVETPEKTEPEEKDAPDSVRGNRERNGQ